MKFNHSGLLLIKAFEGFKPQAYLDMVGVPTIGYGFTEGVRLHDVISQDEADLRLEHEISLVSDRVKNLVKTELNDNQFSSVVCLAYNIGCGKLAESTLLKMINEGDLAGAALQFLRWDKAGGVEVAGLLRRREAEKLLFLS